jgi:hypothetical protein
MVALGTEDVAPAADVAAAQRLSDHVALDTLRGDLVEQPA